MVQSSSASDRWVLEVDGRRADRVDAYGWADAFAVPQGVGSGDAVLDYHAPPARYALVALQGALWLLVLAVAVRMRFGSEASSPSPSASRPDRTVGSPDDGPADGERAHHEPAPDDEPSREGEPVPAGAGAPT